MEAGEAMLYFVTDFIHDNPHLPLMQVTGTLLVLVSLTPVENLISYIQINLHLGDFSWKLGPRWVHGARVWLGALGGAQSHLAAGAHGKGEEWDWIPPCWRSRQAWGCVWVSLVGQGCHSLSWALQARWGWQHLRLGGVMLPA